MILLTFKDDLNAFLKSGALYIALAVVLLIILAIIFLIWKRKKKEK